MGKDFLFWLVRFCFPLFLKGPVYLLSLAHVRLSPRTALPPTSLRCHSEVWPRLVPHVSKPLPFVTGARSLLPQAPGPCVVFLQPGRDPFSPQVIPFPSSHRRPLVPMLLFLWLTRDVTQSRVCVLVRTRRILSRLYAGVFLCVCWKLCNTKERNLTRKIY